MNAKELTKQLKNIGPKLAQRLVDAKIDTPEKLREIGAKEAYLRLYKDGDAYGDFNAAYIYALEGAIRDCDWLDIPAEVKEEYKAFAQALQAKKKPDSADK